MQHDLQQKPITEQTAKRLTGLLSKTTVDQATTKSLEFAKKPVYTIQNSQVVAGIMGTVGLVMFALGVENFITNVIGLSSPYIEIVIGLILLSTSGLLLKKLV
ncbi:MAG: hypothetical protein Q8P25_03225 [Candidatus Curtissbacteria bacterium]|nr:hypothetical protein [Candidatus Curtissbacteria bacterium]